MWGAKFHLIFVPFCRKGPFSTFLSFLSVNSPNGVQKTLTYRGELFLQHKNAFRPVPRVDKILQFGGFNIIMFFWGLKMTSVMLHRIRLHFRAFWVRSPLGKNYVRITSFSVFGCLGFGNVLFGSLQFGGSNIIPFFWGLKMTSVMLHRIRLHFRAFWVRSPLRKNYVLDQVTKTHEFPYE